MRFLDILLAHKDEIVQMPEAPPYIGLRECHGQDQSPYFVTSDARIAWACRSCGRVHIRPGHGHHGAPGTRKRIASLLLDGDWPKSHAVLVTESEFHSIAASASRLLRHEHPHCGTYLIDPVPRMWRKALCHAGILPAYEDGMEMPQAMWLVVVDNVGTERIVPIEREDETSA